MFDARIHTFLTLCACMNYHLTAEQLHMSQPAVTQHIQHLEGQYGVKLFSYEARKLSKTPAGEALEQHARSVLYNDVAFRRQLQTPRPQRVAIGATKTIGEYTLRETILSLLARADIALDLVIDNTENLLHKLHSFQVDLLLVEGYFDQQAYAFTPFRAVELLGICAQNHPFAGKTVPIDALFAEQLLLREEGSGTRAVFEHHLAHHGYHTEHFPRKAYISSFRMIEEAVGAGMGISFVYDVIAKSNPRLSSFRLTSGGIWHKFQFVYLKDTDQDVLLRLLQGEA